MYTNFHGIGAPEQLVPTLERPQRRPGGRVGARVVRIGTSATRAVPRCGGRLPARPDPRRPGGDRRPASTSSQRGGLHALFDSSTAPHSALRAHRRAGQRVVLAPAVEALRVAVTRRA